MSHHVLVVDDDTSVRLVLGMQMRAEGWRVREADTAEQAAAILREEDVDAVVLDHRLPGAWGLRTSTHLREQGFDGPIVIFTGNLDAAVRAEAAELDLPVVAKPDSPQVVDLLRDALGGPKRGRRQRRRR